MGGLSPQAVWSRDVYTVIVRSFSPFSLALVLGAAPAFAAAPVRLVVPGLGAAAPAACPLVLPSAAAVRAGAPQMPPAAAVPAASAIVLPTSAPSPEAPAAEDGEARYARFFDGNAPQPEDDGQAVYPIPARDAHAPRRLPLQLAATRRAVEAALPALRESVSRGDWNGPRTTLDDSCCGDAAPKLGVLLRGLGVPARLVEAEFHYYLILDLPEGQLVVDPTIRQFFGKKNAPRGVPTVFAGTISELHALFRFHAKAKTTSYDPSRIYFRQAVSREEPLRRLDAEVRGGSAAEHEPLRRFLGLPAKMLDSRRWNLSPSQT